MTLVSKEWIQQFHENEGQGIDPAPLVEAALLAHELLEALKVLLAWTEGIHEGMGMSLSQTPLARARELIEKATGAQP